MAETVVKTFDLYNTVFYWVSYNPVDVAENYSEELNVGKSYYSTFYSSNIFGSQIDFFNKLAGQDITSPNINFNTTIQEMPIYWGKYWWEQLMFYTNSNVVNAVSSSNPELYTEFSESIGTLYYISRNNSNQYASDKPYSRILDNLLIPGLDETITNFYIEVMDVFNTNNVEINLSAANYANTDLETMITSNVGLTSYINEYYGWLSQLLPFNTIFIGNLFVPYMWKTFISYENSTIEVDYSNNSISSPVQLTTENLKAV